MKKKELNDGFDPSKNNRFCALACLIVILAGLVAIAYVIISDALNQESSHIGPDLSYVRTLVQDDEYQGKIVQMAQEAKEELYKNEFLATLKADSKVLAEYLLATDDLDEFTEVDTEDRLGTIERAVALFEGDEEIYQLALETAEASYADVHVDTNWIETPSPWSDDFDTYEEYMEYMSHKYPTADMVIPDELQNQLVKATIDLVIPDEAESLWAETVGGHNSSDPSLIFDSGIEANGPFDEEPE